MREEMMEGKKVGNDKERSYTLITESMIIYIRIYLTLALTSPNMC